MLNSKALELVSLAAMRHLSRIASDHCPIVLKLFQQQVHKSRFRKFEDVWISYAAATSVIRNLWAKFIRGDDMEALNKKMSRVLKALFFWSKAKHQNLEVLKEKLKKEIEDLQQEEASSLLFSNSEVLILKSKVNEFNFTLVRLNTWWKQRAKAKWMKEGEVNTSFFHAFANGRRNGNSIKQIRNEDGVLTEDQDCIRRNFFQFFSKKWKYRDCILYNWPMNENILKHEDCGILDVELKLEEVEKVINEL
ncbi:uncharacterized protein LOC110100684 [Dendrobium catenatum]|uniref:uncharacterized protein LOC110100684 n=1 Tax=Dendrobium catenatum TaxID=906689 RepID=UPI0009F2B751|nr:uncharacterized protein LOC110100684 [Dendrobium catenatum]